MPEFFSNLSDDKTLRKTRLKRTMLETTSSQDTATQNKDFFFFDQRSQNSA